MANVDHAARWARLTRLLRSAVHDLFDQSQPFGRLALVHTIFSVGTTLITISLAGTLFFTISPEAAKDKVLLYLLLTIAPFAVVAPALSPLLDRGSYARRTSIAVSSVGSAVLVFLMANDINGLLLFPEAFGVLVLSKLYLVAKAALVPSMTDTEDDLASANAKLAVLASLAGFVASPVAVGLLQIGAPWVLRVSCVVFLLGGVAAVRLPKMAEAVRPKPADTTPDGRPLLGPPVPKTGRSTQGAGRPLYERPQPTNQERTGADQCRPGAAAARAAAVRARGRARPDRDVGDPGSGWIRHVLPGFCAPPPPRGDVVVRNSPAYERDRLSARVRSRADPAPVPVRATADPVLAGAVGGGGSRRGDRGVAVGAAAAHIRHRVRDDLGQAVVRLDRAEERGPHAPQVARLRSSRPSCNWSGCSAR